MSVLADTNEMAAENALTLMSARCRSFIVLAKFVRILLEVLFVVSRECKTFEILIYTKKNLLSK